MSNDKMREALYSERDIEALDEQGGYYMRHVMAMTAEGLHSKSDIAAELAWRDAEINRLESQQPESEPVGVFGFLRRTFGGTREFQGYLCNGVAEPANGDILYTGPQPSAQVPEWTDKQCLEFIKVALRHVEHTDGSTLRLDDVRLGVKFALKAAPSIAEKEKNDE